MTYVMKVEKRPMYYILKDKEPEPCEDILRWASSNGGVQRVASDTIGEVFISTVFLGMDHAHEGDPILFETMIFGGPRDGYCDRCSTWDEAEETHRKAVKLCEQSNTTHKTV